MDVRCSALVAAVALLMVAGQGCAGLVAVDESLYPTPPKDAVTFWGHACCYVDIDGFGIVTDPVFEKVTLVRFRKIAMPPRGAYEKTRVILISHAHPDHLSTPTIETFPSDAVVLCPEPSAKHLEDIEQKVIAMKPGDEYEIPDGRIVAVAAHHMGGRYSVSAAEDGRALGYVIETASGTVFYSGDTNLFPGFEDVGWNYEPDVAIININGHLHSTDAVRAAWATRSRVVIPAHWGAFGYLFLGTRGAPRDHDEMSRLLGETLVTLEVGESVPIPASSTPEIP